MNAGRARVGPAWVGWAAPGPGQESGAAVPLRLSEAERRRAEGFAADRRDAFLLGRTLVAQAVGQLFPDADGWRLEAARCERCGARHGRIVVSGAPAVAGVAYAPGLVVAAVAPVRSADRLGVDAEVDVLDPIREADLTRLLGSSRTPVLRRWTRIEAVVKADGRGLLVDPGDVRLSSRCGRIGSESTRYRVADLPGPAGYLLSLAWSDAAASAAEPGPATG